MVSCFSQSKDEIVFEFNNAKTSFFIRADLQGDFSCLTFPESFKRARKNSIDLLNEALMKKVVGVQQFENERSFVINLEDDLGVLFKMHGNKGNVVLLNGDVEIGRFKNNIAGGAETDRHIDWSKENFEKHIDQLEKVYFTFGKKLIKKDWDYIQQLKSQLEDPKYYVTRRELSLVPIESAEVYTDPIKAVNEFYFLHVSKYAFEKEKTSVLSRLRTDIQQTRSWLQKTSAKLEELRSDDHYKAWGDLVMANLHSVTAGSKSIEVENFYNNNESIVIPLDKTLSPQKNAERYYRKGKNQQIEITKLKEGLDKKSKELSVRELELAKAEEATSVKSLPAPRDHQSSTTVSLPYRQFEFKSFKIWVGKDAKTNDELTLKYSFKEDLWMHVRDDSGSHVLLKHQANKPFPKDVIEYAASIAAFFSKRKTEPLCAVIVTPKKFVRKRKGDPAGAVVVEREEVVLVEPHGPTHNS